MLKVSTTEKRISKQVLNQFLNQQMNISKKVCRQKHNTDSDRRLL